MDKRILRNILILLLVSSFLFLVFRHISSLKENITLLENQKQNLLQDLEKEREAVEREKAAVERLNTRNAGLRDYLKAARKRMNKSFSTLSEAEEKIDKLGAQFSILKAENSALLEEREKLVKDNEAMRMKLNSVDELKIAIRELKNQAQIMGNRGFLLKDGQTTSAAKVKIEVIPAPR